MDMSIHPRVGMTGLKRILAVAFKARRTVCVIGPPGIGKTAVVYAEAVNAGFLAVYFDLGNSAREDVMLPCKVTVDGTETVAQIPLNTLKQACERPVVLIIDELTRCDRNKQAVAMALMHDRRIGGMTLHPGTVVVAMGNGEESAGTASLNDALINRVGMYAYMPTHDEMREVVAGLGAEGSTKRALLSDVAAAAGIRTEMLVLQPPDGAQEKGAQWPTPRAWESGADMLAQWLDDGNALDGDALAMLGGFIGPATAAAFFAVMAHRDKLPSPEAISLDPFKSKLPPDAESGVAALGVIRKVHAKNVNAGWVYLGRFAAEFPDLAASVSRDLYAKAPAGKVGDPVYDAAMKAFVGVSGKSSASASRARR